ncbi:MAG: cyclic pyranopterin monophosphate synthase MoaC, partial [Terriglobales bacterium]
SVAMLSHLDTKNQPAMVDVSGKPETLRTAHATAIVMLPPALATELRDGEIISKKGPVFQTAILAGIMGAKRTAELIPLCHPLHLDDVRIEIETPVPGEAHIHCRVRAHDRTGVEMEALTGASVAALTLYDMGKAAAPGIVIKEVRLREKTGGKRDWTTP